MKGGEHVRLVGWLAHKREHGGKVFMDVRDGAGYLQVVAEEGPRLGDDFAVVEQASIESAVAVGGETVLDERAPQGVEVHLDEFHVVSPAEEWPITQSAKESPSFLFDNRHLTLRGPTSRAIMQVRSELHKAAHSFFQENGYTWMSAPTLITSAVEGGATLFTVDYFGSECYLSQSAQLYEEAAISAFEKVYISQPSFRAEKSRTRKHLTEYWHIEAEAAFAEHKDIMKVQEELLTAMIGQLKENRGAELRELGRSEIEVPDPPFPKIAYADALDVLAEEGFDLEWGEDFGAREERALSEEFEQPFFVTEFPTVSRTFYHKPKEDQPDVTLSSDLMAPGGFGELTSGGERITDHDLLLQRIEDEGLDASSYEWYLDLRRYGLPPHSGFGLGLERLMWWALDLDHIRDTTMFPRTIRRISP